MMLYHVIPRIVVYLIVLQEIQPNPRTVKADEAGRFLKNAAELTESQIRIQLLQREELQNGRVIVGIVHQGRQAGLDGQHEAFLHQTCFLTKSQLTSTFPTSEIPPGNHSWIHSQ